MSELLTPIEVAEMQAPPMQKLFVVGNILPGTDLRPERLERFVQGLSEVTGMNLFGAVQIKTPDHYDPRTLSDLTRPPEDINVSWMWDDSGGQMYVFPSRSFWTTIDLHTCKEFDNTDALSYIAGSLNFRENMRFAEQDRGASSEWQPYSLQLPESPYVRKLSELLETDLSHPDAVEVAGRSLEDLVYSAVEQGWGDRLASLLTEEQRSRIRDLHGTYEVGVDNDFMDRVIGGEVISAGDYRFQKTYDRLALMEAEAAGLTPNDRVLHIGTGWPGTAIGLYRQNGIPAICVEIDPEMALKSKLALEKLGLYGEDAITVVARDGTTLNPRPYDAVIISAMVSNEDKRAIIGNVSGTSLKIGERPVILRQPADRARSLFYQPLPKRLGHSLLKAHTKPGINDPLRSLVVTLDKARGVNRLDDRYLVESDNRLETARPL